jgi:hypothetical protein
MEVLGDGGSHIEEVNPSVHEDELIDLNDGDDKQSSHPSDNSDDLIELEVIDSEYGLGDDDQEFLGLIYEDEVISEYGSDIDIIKISSDSKDEPLSS